MNSLAFEAEIFYRRLMSVVDDFGRFDGRVSILKGRLYALKPQVRETDISHWIAACVKAGLIALYQTEGKPYLLFHKLGEARAVKSKYPPPSASVSESLNGGASKGGHAETGDETCKHLRADENICLQTKTNAPSSSSSSSSSSIPTSIPPTPPGGDGSSAGKKTRRRDNIVEEHPRFAEFWAVYPRHEARTKAAIAFLKLDPSPELVEQILAAVSLQRRNGCLVSRVAEDGRSVVPFPSSWLKAKRWLDEPETTATNTARPPSPDAPNQSDPLSEDLKAKIRAVDLATKFRGAAA